MGPLFDGLVKGAALIFAGFVFGMAAQGGDLPQSAGSNPGAQNSSPQDKHALIAPSLQGSLKVTRVVTSIGTRGYLKIQLDLENVAERTVHFNYRIEWYDSDGTRLPLVSTVTPWMLRAHEKAPIAITAPTPAAKDFEVAFLDAP